MRKLLVFTAISFICISLRAQTASSKIFLTETSPEAAGMSSERLTKIDGLVKEYVDKRWLSGAIVLVARNGKIIYYKAIGYDDTENKTPLKRDAIFRIASQTKAITSVATMILYEDGKILLDDPVSKYIPEFKNQRVLDKFNASDTTYTTVPVKREVTIRDLLTHTSGLGYAQIGSREANAIYYKNGIVAGFGLPEKMVLGDKMKKLGSMPLFHQPGERMTYGLNSDLLGYLIEVVSGMSFDQFFRKRIFEPLGMKDTYFYLPPEKYNRLAKLYSVDSSGVHQWKQIPLNGTFTADYPVSQNTYYSGGAGLSSTALDYSIFLQMLLNGGEYNGKRILSPNTVRMMTMNQIGDLTLWNGYNKFGLGFEINSITGSSKSPLPEGAYSWGGMFSSSYWVDPKEKIVCQIVLQEYPNIHAEIHEKLKVLIYQAIDHSYFFPN